MTDSNDLVMEKRKDDHINLYARANAATLMQDKRFSYHPMLGQYPNDNKVTTTNFLGKQMQAPLWISSMTGGAAHAAKINLNLAKCVADFKLGLGLGSCRPLLLNDKHFDDFNLRPLIGDDRPFYANFGIAQMEQILKDESLMHRMNDVCRSLKVDGIIIHVNPLQEWMQDEGDVLTQAPLKTIQNFLKVSKWPIIVKEVGQGMGATDLSALMQLPLAAIEFAAWGGTNFTVLESMRQSNAKRAELAQYFGAVGHTAEEMLENCHNISLNNMLEIKCKNLIISGGIRHFLDGHFLMMKAQATLDQSYSCVFGMAGNILRHANGTYDELHSFMKAQLDGYTMANAFLKLKD